MANSFHKMAKNLEERLKTLEKNLAKETANVVMCMMQELVLNTPVDTSKALSNWQVSLNSPISNEINAYFEGQKGSTFGASSQAAIIEGQNVLSDKITQGVVYLSNLTDYISDLNRGTSKQHPGGFVEAAAVLGRSKVKDIKIRF